MIKILYPNRILIEEFATLVPWKENGAFKKWFSKNFKNVKKIFILNFHF